MHKISRDTSGVDTLAIYTRQVARIPMHSLEQERQVGLRARAGDRSAIDELVEANLRFVIAVARKYKSRGVDFPDIIAAGNIGLMQAAERFDPEYGDGNRFVSYAIHWIRQAITKEIDRHNKTVRSSQTQAGRNRRVKRTVEKFQQIFGRQPSVAELVKLTKFRPERVQEALGYRVTMHSLESPSHSDSATPLGHLLGAQDNREERDLHTEQRVVLNRILDEVLKPRERDIIREYFGIGEHGEMRNSSLTEIGIAREVTRERARQIKERALEKIRKALPRHPELRELFVTQADMDSRRAPGMPAPRYLSPVEKVEEVSDDSLDYLDDLDPTLFAAPKFSRRAVIPRDDALPTIAAPRTPRATAPVSYSDHADDDFVADLSAEEMAELLGEVPASLTGTSRTTAINPAPTLASVQADVRNLFETEGAAHSAQYGASNLRRVTGRAAPTTTTGGSHLAKSSAARMRGSAKGPAEQPLPEISRSPQADTAAKTQMVAPTDPSAEAACSELSESTRAPAPIRGKRKPVTTSV